MKTVKLTIKAAGFCIANKNHALSKTSRKKIKFYATFGIIKHPTKGVILFDTGYTTDFYRETKKFPFSVYANITKVTIHKEEEAKSILQKIGIETDEVRFIIISHFHADHIGGLRDFPNAQLICSQTSFEAVKNRKGLKAVIKGFIPNLLPANFEKRAQLLEFQKEENLHPIFGKFIDLFEDGSIKIVQLEGHAKGQIGAIVQTENQEVFLIADGAWLKENYEELHFPSKTIKIFIDSWKELTATLTKIHHYQKKHPETLIIPCHCENTLTHLPPYLK